MAGIDWDVIRRKGERGELTFDEMTALIHLARMDMLRRTEEAEALNVCGYCWTKEHTHDDCPIQVLEEASTPNIWYEPKSETEVER